MTFLFTDNVQLVSSHICGLCYDSSDGRHWDVNRTPKDLQYYSTG